MTARPSGFLSVMADRAPVTSETLDYFPTPPWAARAGGELIKLIDPGARTAWEPACGGGHMAHGLRDYFDAVSESDIVQYGTNIVGDFLSLDDHLWWPRVDWIVTNPPFIHGEAFVREAWKRAKRGVAMLLRLSFLEGVSRHALLHHDLTLYCVAPFAERVPMVKGRWDPKASTATAYAWFIWVKPGCVEVPDRPFLASIPPGSRPRLTKPSDLARFADRADLTLFPESDDE